MLKKYILLILIISYPLLWGCDTVTVVGGRTIGFSSGRFINEDRSLQAFHDFPFDKVWTAAIKAMEEMKAETVEKSRKIATGSISGVIQDERVIMELAYAGSARTSLSIRVGIAGDLLSSRLLNEKIANYLKASRDEQQP